MVPGIQLRYATARDGTRIGYQIRGQGPCVVLANGLGGNYITYKYLYEALGGYRTLCWDYRGLFSSDPAADPRANTVAHQVDDLMTILELEQVDDFVIVGWSMGVQVALETLRHHASRVRGLYAINGTYGRTFHTVLGSRLVGQTIPMLLRLVRAQAALVGRASRRAAGSPALFAALRRVGFVAKTIDMELFREIASGFLQVDWRIYSDLLARLDEHDAEEVLDRIAVPVTIAAGTRDLWTPASTSQHMHRSIRGARLIVIEGGTHYTPVEYPRILVDELGLWLDRVPGWERVPAASGASRSGGAR
jgi:pimeloyl-ACP methyl ester carboxylesterase